MNFNKGNGASFCKTLLSNSENYLPLPSAFAEKHLKKQNSKKPSLVLETTSTSNWTVNYLKIDDKHYFTDGWLQFVQENQLQTHDTLVFWLLSPPPNPMFQVFIYAPDGSLKYPTTGSETVNDKHNPDDAAADNEKKPPVVEIISDDESSKNVQRSLMRVIRKSYVRRLPLTKAFVNATGINGYNRLKLKNKNGKIWEVALSKYRGGVGKVDIPYMTRGLFEFMRDNKMEAGDRCKFKHVKGNLLRFRVIKKKKDL